MVSKKINLALFLIVFHIGSCYGQEIFRGLVKSKRYTIYEDYTVEKYPRGLSPFDTVTWTNYVCGDTILTYVTRTDMNLDNHKTVYLGKYKYIYDNSRSTYLKVPAIRRVNSLIPAKKWKKGDGYMLSTPHPETKDRVVSINYDPDYLYSEQANFGGEFSEYFFHLGGLTKTSIKGREMESVMLNEFKFQDVNCKELIGNFIVEDVSEDEWVKAYFGDTDTTLIASPERQSIEDYHDFVAYDSISSNIENVFKGKVVYLDFWASWCAPCRKEIPYLQEIHRKYSSDQLSIVSVSMDKLEGMDKWKEAINLLGMNWFNYFLREGFENPLIGQLGIQAIPWYILIDKNGKIAAPHAPRPSDPRIEGLLDKLINEN